MARTAAAAADAQALVHQRDHGDLPALANLADALDVIDLQVGEIDLIEVGRARHLVDRPHLDTRRVHVDPEHRHALVLGHIRIGAGEQQAEVGEMGAAGPHLLAIDRPLIAVADGAGAGRRGVRAARGLAEQLAPDLLAQHGGTGEALLVGLVPDGEDGRHAHAKTDGEGVAGGGELRLLLAEDHRLPGLAAAAAPGLGPGDAGVARLSLAALPGAGRVHVHRVVVANFRRFHLPGGIGFQPSADLGAVGGLFGRVVEVHDRLLQAATLRRSS